MPVGVGGWHHGLSRTYLVVTSVVCFLCSFNMTNQFGNVWEDIIKDAARLLAPTNQFLSSVGPKSHPLQRVSEGSMPGKSVSHGSLPVSLAVRAEGSQCVLPRCEESGFVPGEMLKRSCSFRKSSWRRAVQRAARAGKAQYRGRWFRFHSLPSAVKQEVRSRLRHLDATDTPGLWQKEKTCRPKGCLGTGLVQAHQLRYASVNVGGLCTGKFGEVMQHASSTGVTALCLQETRWAYSKTWNSGAFAVIHSGEPNVSQS